ncbi:MAG: hypothetical protein IJU51_07730 [Clostridia bacterium]|nr:hypothetical protein [Clostridia bacterium]
MNNNPNPYQQPGQPQQPQPPMAPMPPMQPYQYAPMKPKIKFFDAEMAEILACACSALGLFLAVVSATVSGTVTFVYGLIMTIISLVFSVGGLFLNLLLGNKKKMRGEARGALLSWGLVFALVGVILFLFLIFFSSCMTCYYSKINFRWPS